MKKQQRMKTVRMWATVRRHDGKIVEGPDRDKQHVGYLWPRDEYRIARVEIREVKR